MPEVRLRHFLPALMGSLHQQKAEGELVLEQNDGTRRLYWADGDLKYLRSDAVGEQFGNFLIRRGVLDMASLKELLADGEGSRVGDRVVQWGLMTREERDERLNELLGSVLLHAMEHPIIRMTWIPEALDDNLSGDLQFRMDHRLLVWETFRNAKVDRELVDMFQSEPEWRWKAKKDLLESLSDLPLTPTLAYALSLLGTEPLGCDTIGSLTGLPQEEASRLVATLWALGGLTLVRGELPLLPKVELPPPPVPEPEPELDVEPILLVQEDLAPPAPPMFPADALELDMPEPTPTPTAIPPMPDDVEPSPADRARHLLVKAKSYVMQDRTSEAIRALEQAIKLDGDSPGAYESWMLLGRLRLSNPAWSTRAIEALQVASRLNPRAAEPWALMGELYHRKGFRANAQGCFRRALELDPSVAVPAGWSAEDPTQPLQKDGQGGIMGKLRGMFSREKD
ncbi:MAG: response regulator [Holophagaceae bacterium]|nr:response regulator [Holophagaceae bacterium]